MKYREKEWLEEQIKIYGANGRKIALANNYSPVTIQRYMKKFNLYEKKEKVKEVVKKEKPIYRNKEWLQEQFNLYETVTEVSRQTGFPRTCITRYAKKFNIYTRKYTRENVNTVDEKFFETIDTEEKAYWLGFFMADGNMYIYEDGKIQFSIKIKDSDYEHLVKFKNTVKFSGKITRKYSTRKETKCYYSEIKIYNKNFCNNLIKHGIVPQKTGKEQIPKTVPNNLKKYFIRGFLDGDGWISGDIEKLKIEVGMCSTNKNVCYDIFNYLNDILNIKMRISCYKNVYKVNTSKKEFVYKILKFLYKDANIYLDRKYKKATIIMLEYEIQFL